MLGIVRLRRYKSLPLLAIIAIIVFQLYSSRETNSAFSVEKLKEYTSTISKPNSPQSVVDTPNQVQIPPPAIPPIEKPPPRVGVPTKEEKPIPPPPAPVDPVETPKPKTEDTVLKPKPKPIDDEDRLPHQHDQENRPSTVVDPSQRPAVHWLPPTEHFPVPKDQIIQLPQKYNEIPQIQASFAREVGSKREVRLERQKAVKEAMGHTWKSYRKYAWMHDQLSPVSKYFTDPFGGWGATLVDALDTLWIMGMEEEFLEAIEAVGKIDFTTTPIQSIPVFETVIRYLGGLIGAYDVSGGKHQILLNKAIELADMLYGVFDTPNRMPMLHWGWRPQQTAREGTGESRAVSAELGSLTVEFTRLAQITGNSTYFDAVQRITNALEEFQPKTSLPGMWPIWIDCTGCKVVQVEVPPRITTPAPAALPPSGIFADGTTGKVVEVNVPKIIPVHGHEKRQEVEQPVDWLAAAQGGHITAEEDEKPKDVKDISIVASEAATHPGLTIEAQSKKILHEGSDGQLQDGRSNAIGKQLVDAAATTTVQKPQTSPSCLPQGLTKPAFQREERFTLGGMADSLYEYLIKEYILLGGSEQYKKMYESSMAQAKKHLFFRPLAEGNPDVLLSGNVNIRNGEITFDTDSGHLSCFTGGMLALGARALGNEADLEIGAKLTDGCVWAYSSFASGIMPESLQNAYCADATNCVFNSTEYYEQLVPKFRRPKDTTALEPHQHAKRGMPAGKVGTPVVDAVQKPYPTTLDEVAKEIIEEESLPSGFTHVGDRRYILRPEAIESVFIMYRLTADVAWQNKGWKMWESVAKATRTEFAFSAVNDVTRERSDPKFVQLDEMESFWLAETLKYYYLLFSEPELISLDEYVLNTEAHPLKRIPPTA